MSSTLTVLPIPLTEEEKRQRLKRMKVVAGIMLVAMAIIFVCSKLMEKHYPWLEYVIAFSEAAIVGGLADWFAVTALFRYPMGIPFPHTAIVPNSKQRIGRALGNFVEKNFLKPDLVIARLEKLDLAGDVGRWLSNKHSTDALSERLVNVLPHVVDALDDQQTKGFLGRLVVRQVEKIDLSKVAGAFLADLPDSLNYEALIDEILDLASEFLEDNKHRFRDKLGERTDWWIPSFVDQRLYDSITGSLEDLIRELRDPQHERRIKMEHALRRSISNLRHNKAFLAKFNDLRDQLVSGTALTEYVGEAWERMKNDLRHDVAAPDSLAREQLSDALQKLGEVLTEDALVKEKLNGFMQQALIQGILPYRSSFASFIAQVVQDWDADDIGTRIELNVGRDLQFIRINGTLVGGFVGLMVHIVWETLVSHGLV